MRNRLIKRAESFLGVCEPTGDDQFIKYYNKITGTNFATNVAWCAIFVTTVARMENVDLDTIPNFACCDQGTNYFRKKGRYEKSKFYGGSYKPKKGDIIFYSSKNTQNDSTHVGYIVEVNGDTIKAIEGNKQDAVGYRSISASNKYIIGYGLLEEKRESDENIDVKKLQKYLSFYYKEEIEKYVGKLKIDGIYGKVTRKACICAWKIEANKNNNGYLFNPGNENFLGKCKEYAAGKAMIKKGTKNKFVKLLQAMLNAKGIQAGEIDGECGEKTTEAIKEFQKKNKLTVDGTCGSLTWEKIMGE